MELNREQPIYGGPLLWDSASGDLSSVQIGSSSPVTLLVCTRAWKNGRQPADLYEMPSWRPSLSASVVGFWQA
jgi:hypothetical protein